MNELQRYITVLNIDPEDGSLSPASKETPYHVEGALDSDTQNGAEIVLAPDGDTLYASVRNYNRTGAVLVFNVTDGFPAQIQSISTGGQAWMAQYNTPTQATAAGVKS